MRIYHKAKLINDNGDVSALCSDVPRKINMKTSTWTTTDAAVTCPRCIKKMAELSTSMPQYSEIPG